MYHSVLLIWLLLAGLWFLANANCWWWWWWWQWLCWWWRWCCSVSMMSQHVVTFLSFSLVPAIVVGVVVLVCICFKFIVKWLFVCLFVPRFFGQFISFGLLCHLCVQFSFCLVIVFFFYSSSSSSSVSILYLIFRFCITKCSKYDDNDDEDEDDNDGLESFGVCAVLFWICCLYCSDNLLQTLINVLSRLFWVKPCPLFCSSCRFVCSFR